jgi:hypothetical protein
VRRVLQVFEPHEGGVPEHVLQLSVGLRDRGWRVDVAVPAASPFVDRFADARLTVHRMPLKRRPGRADVASAGALRRLDGYDSFEIVHAHSSKAGVLVRAVLPRPSGRVVYSPHCFGFNRSGAGGRLLAWAVEQALVPRTGAIVAVCDWERRQARRVERRSSRTASSPAGRWLHMRSFGPSRRELRSPGWWRGSKSRRTPFGSFEPSLTR